MYTGRPLFPGKTNEDELVRIFRVLGTPTETTMPGFTEYPEYKDTFPRFPPQPLNTVLPAMDPYGLDLLARMLTYDPEKRISARDALKHPYFSAPE